MKLTLDQSECRGISESTIGGKAYNLAWLGQRQCPVPPWFVVTTDAFKACLEFNFGESFSDLMAKLEADGASLEFARRIHDKLAEAVLSKELEAELEQRLSSLLASGAYVAVRSSVVGEDSAESSFAGQMETFLFVKTLEEVKSSIAKCFASAFTDRAIQYRLDRNLPINDISAAVICQLMVDSEKSGVVFTAHPIRGNRNEHLISVAWGLGEGIVSGECNTDEFVVCHKKAAYIMDKVINDKDLAMRFDRVKGSGTLLVEVPADQRLIPPDRGADRGIARKSTGPRQQCI